MANLYKVIDIQGKGFGCVATQDIPKGTLILAEKPQIVLALSGNLRENVCSLYSAGVRRGLFYKLAVIGRNLSS